MTLGISEVVQYLFETSLRVTSQKTIWRVNIVFFTAVLLVNEMWSTTNYDRN